MRAVVGHRFACASCILGGAQSYLGRCLGTVVVVSVDESLDESLDESSISIKGEIRSENTELELTSDSSNLR